MSLTVGSYIVANISLQYIALRAVVSGYELVFGTKLEPLPSLDKGIRHAVLHGAECTIKPGGGQEMRLAYARFDVPVKITGAPDTVRSATTIALRLPLSPPQLAAIEDLRAGGDLVFELTPTGEGQRQAGQHYIQDTWRRTIPKSEWIQKLRDAVAADTLLIEVPIAWSPTSEKAKVAGERLRNAQMHFHHGNYTSCVAACRTVIAELHGPAQNSKPKTTDGQTKSRRDMTKSEREADLVEAVRNYTHLAHHAETEGGYANYSRSEARFLLTITAAIAARSLMPD